MTARDAVDAGDPAAGALARLRRLVELESPSDDPAALRALAAELAAALVDVGAEVDTVDVPEVGEHVVARLPGRDDSLAPLLVLGHFDTVHPVGSFDPVFHTADGRAHGPGTFDMKGGWACLLEALARLRAAGGAPRRPLVILATCDEETGSESSRALIEQLARPAGAVLVPEPPLAGGAAKTRRKGVAWYRLAVDGRAAHAGLAPADGVNALEELAHQTLALAALADPDAGTTVTVTEAAGGTASNVVPARAWLAADVRFWTAAEAQRVDAAVRSLEPVVPGATLTVSGGINRPPLERSDDVAELFARAREAAAEDGWALEEGASGGASDGCYTAALGTPTLDGLGPAGGGAHAATEHVEIGDLARRVRLFQRLLERL